MLEFIQTVGRRTNVALDMPINICSFPLLLFSSVSLPKQLNFEKIKRKERKNKQHVKKSDIPLPKKAHADGLDTNSAVVIQLFLHFLV